MKRIIDYHLKEWKKRLSRKPLLVRGARQIGKTTAIRHLGVQFDNIVEINFELNPEYAAIFEKNLDPERIIQELYLITEQKIIPGKTLLFFDEIQQAPNAVKALRYFYEKIPELHVICAGSLLDFVIQEIGLPVGRVSSLYMYPMSFIEFLYACNHVPIIESIFEKGLEEPINLLIHEKILRLLGQYLVIGGMPEAVKKWRDIQDPFACFLVHQELVDTYRQDFYRYAKEHQIKYLDVLFNSLPLQLAKKLQYHHIEGDYRKRELQPCLNLLETAGIVHRITHTDANGIPVGAQADPSLFKVILLDVAITQALLGQDPKSWLLNPFEEFVNKGELVEAFVGQELLAYANPIVKQRLFYWNREKKGGKAEIDYLIQKNNMLIPVEVKSNKGTTLKSMNLFLELKKFIPFGIRFSAHNYSEHKQIHSYPLYAVAKAMDGSYAHKILE